MWFEADDCSPVADSVGFIRTQYGSKMADEYLFDRKADDIEYYCESQLRGEPTSVADRHFHPVEPRTVRLSVRVAL